MAVLACFKHFVRPPNLVLLLATTVFWWHHNQQLYRALQGLELGCMSKLICTFYCLIFFLVPSCAIIGPLMRIIGLIDAGPY